MAGRQLGPSFRTGSVAWMNVVVDSGFSAPSVAEQQGRRATNVRSTAAYHEGAMVVRHRRVIFRLALSGDVKTASTGDVRTASTGDVKTASRG